MHILVVDDDPACVRSLAEYLRRRDHRVSTAPNGRKGLSLMASDPPDLVISDIQMPEMDGIEYLQRIREDYPDLPVILMTGYATADSAISALRNRACDYLQKPVSLQELQGCIDRIISDRQP